MLKKNMPANWVPPAPAWQSVWHERSDPLVAGYFGIQAEQPDLLQGWAKEAFDNDHAPLSVEQGAYVDQAGVRHYMYIAYWRLSSYRRWWRQNAAWWEDARRLTEGVGYWREIIVMPFDHFETLHSTTSPHGVSVSSDAQEGPIEAHGYPGAMRDRIPLSETVTLKSASGVDVPINARVTDQGKRVRLVPPEKMCVIRSGQNWSMCDAKEKAYYLENVHPVLLKGMAFLANNPEATNCYAMRFVSKKGHDWEDTEESFGLGYATDVHAFEEWAKSHPTHLAIFGSFMKMVETFGEQMKLKLWHEVSVLPDAGSEFEYIACAPETGLLGYALKG